MEVRRREATTHRAPPRRPPDAAPPSGRPGFAAARDAVPAVHAWILTRAPACLLARLALLFVAFGRDLRLAHAALAHIAFVEARCDRRTRMADVRVRDVGLRADRVLVLADRAQVDEEAGARRQLAAAEAVTAVRRQRPADIHAGLGLRSVQLGAGL